jgi:hypothetical protein
MNAHTKIAIAEPTLEDVNAATHASLCRCIENAPVENKLKLFHLMSRTAADELKQRKQQVVDDLWFVANVVGLVDLLGVTSVQHAMSLAFEPFELRAEP